MKTLAWFLTAAAILIGADVFIASDMGSSTDTATIDESPLMGGNGAPPTPDPLQ